MQTLSNIFYLVPALLSLGLLLFGFRIEDVLILAILSEAAVLFFLYVSRFVGRNIFRKLVHVTAVIILIHFLLLEVGRLPIAIIVFSLLILSVIAHHKPKIFPKPIENLAKEGVMNIVQFWVAVLLLLLFVPYRFIIIGLLAFLGDPAAYFVGKRFGRTKINGKTLEGSLALFLVASALIFVFTNNLMLSIASAFVAAIVELFAKKLDDNFTVPIAAAVFVYAASFV